jgi:hypothetical protein
MQRQPPFVMIDFCSVIPSSDLTGKIVILLRTGSIFIISVRIISPGVFQGSHFNAEVLKADAV